MNKVFKWIFAILVIASVFCGVGCKDKVEVELKPTKQYGTVKGKAFYSNESVDDHSGIQITLVATDGLRSVEYCVSRGIATNARSVSDIKTTSEDGSYSFENIPVGTYTIWASSRNSVEEAIETNVNVRANEVVTANDLNLVATGNVKGTITIDGKTDGTLGLDVFIAGTSYVAKVGKTGNYEISKVPASKGYMLCVQKGEYTTIINEDLEVKAKETIEVGCKNLLSEDWAIENEAQTNPTFKWLGEFEKEPENPDLYDAYYNTTDGCSYIWTGNDWDLLAKSGEDGVNGEDGKDGVDGLSIVWKGELEAAPENPELNWAYYNINTGCSYIWNGSDWDLLTQHAHTYEWTSDEKSHWYACACGAKKDFEEHTYGTWNVTTEPTTNAEGKNERTCSNCGYVDSVVLQPVPEGFRFVKGGTITGAKNTNNWAGVFIEGRTVTLSDFYMGKYEVTQEEYASVMTGQKVTVEGLEYALESNPNYCTKDSTFYTLFNGDVQEKRPVEGVTWYDAVWYCNALSEKEGLTPAYDIEVTSVNSYGNITNANVNLRKKELIQITTTSSDKDKLVDCVLLESVFVNGEELFSAGHTLHAHDIDELILYDIKEIYVQIHPNGYRLPTAAEWEYAARGGDPTVADWNYVFSGADTAEGVSYSSSKNSGLDSVGWYCYNNITGITGDSAVTNNVSGKGTHQVGKKAANRLGLYDISGNVWEWCYDWSGVITTTTPADGATSGDSRIIRGGGWNHNANFASVSFCLSEFPSRRVYSYGFRVVRPSSK